MNFLPQTCITCSLSKLSNTFMFSFAQINTLELFWFCCLCHVPQPVHQPIMLSLSSRHFQHLTIVHHLHCCHTDLRHHQLFHGSLQELPIGLWSMLNTETTMAFLNRGLLTIIPSIKILQCFPISIRVNRTKSLSTTALPHTSPHTHISPGSCSTARTTPYSILWPPLLLSASHSPFKPSWIPCSPMKM